MDSPSGLTVIIRAVAVARIQASGSGNGGGGKPPQPPTGAANGRPEWWPDNVVSLNRQPAGTQGRVTIPTDLNRGDAPKPHELATMARLAEMGFDPDFNRVSTVDGVKTADITMEQLLWEMKSPQGASPNTISHQLSRIVKQADRGVIDLARTPLDEVVVVDVVQNRLRSDSKLKEIIVVFRDGSGVRIISPVK